jgi:hypothetical protein
VTDQKHHGSKPVTEVERRNVVGHEETDMRYLPAFVLLGLSTTANSQDILMCFKYGKKIPGPDDTIACMHNKTDLSSGEETTLSKLYKQNYRLASFEIVPSPEAPSFASYIYYLDK